MDIILQGLENVAAIQNDILITGKDDEQHIQNLNTVLSRLDSYGLRLQLNKCKFMQRSVTYMGCIISAEGISPTEEKVEAIKEAPHSDLSDLNLAEGLPWNDQLPREVHPQSELNSSVTQPAPSERSRVLVVPPVWRGLQQGKGIPLFLTCAGALQS